jgi:tetratricopeptide (TPR) repeat protein
MQNRGTNAAKEQNQTQAMLSHYRSYRKIPTADQKGLTALMVELCESHFRLFPGDRFALIWYAMAKIQLGQYTQAARALRRSISLCRGDRKGIRLASAQMGHLFREKGDFKQAALWYRRGLRADPEYGDGYNFLGLVYFRSGRLKQAELCYRRAIKFPAESLDEAYFNLGGVLLAKRRYQEAIECYRKAIEIDPKYTIAKKRLKDALLALELKNPH